MAYTKATRKKCNLKMSLSGPTGSGKTESALLIGTGLGGKIALLDSENKSASLYSDRYDFDADDIYAPFSPEAYIEKIQEAESEGYETLILDSITPEWSGNGGILQIVDSIASTKFKNNSWSAWSEATPRHQAFIDAVLQSKINIICTMRSKMETSQETDEKGKKRVVRLGMKSEQRDDIDYYFTLCFDLIHDGNIAVASKDRTRLFIDELPKRITLETGKKIKNWLELGIDESLPVVQAEINCIKNSIEFLEYFHKALPKKPLTQNEKIIVFNHCKTHGEQLGLIYSSEIKSFIKKEAKHISTTTTQQQRGY